jgi:RNA polymerase sigma-70 factor (ECF subfamily)
MSEAARRAAERAARESYGRLLALVARRAGDIAGAEDALAHAFAAALATWPERGVPERPEAWLLTAARRALGHQWRAAKVRDAGRETIEMLHAEADARGGTAWPDERLALLFVCAHPAIAPEARTPLMLQTVLGLDAGRIAGAFWSRPQPWASGWCAPRRRSRRRGCASPCPSRTRWPSGRTTCSRRSMPPMARAGTR